MVSYIPTLTPIEPQLDGNGLTIGIIVARYNWPITGTLLQLAQEELAHLHVEDVHTISVPGAYELPSAAQAMLRGGRYDALICLGCVMKGETRHDVVVSDAAAQGILRVSLETQIPIVFGVMCAESQAQAEARLPRGRECARTAVEMARTIQALHERQRR